jgi:hypothetical protein
MAAIFGLFLFAISLIIISANVMAWIMSFFYETRKDYDDMYVNPYRLVPRQEAESYKRYERREYQDSLKNRRKSK